MRGRGKEPKSLEQGDEEKAVRSGYEEGKVCRTRWGKVLLLGGKGREVLTMGDGSEAAVQLLSLRAECLGTPGEDLFGVV